MGERARRTSVHGNAGGGARLASAFLDMLPDPVLLVDTAGMILGANSAVFAFLGYAEQELLGKPVELLVPERLRATHTRHRKEYLKDPLQRSMGSDLRLQARKKDGSLLAVDIALSPATVDGQRLIMAVIRDITPHVAAREFAERLAEERRVLALIGRILNSSPRIERCYEELTAEIRNLLPWDRIVLALIDRGSQTYVDAYWSGLSVEDWQRDRHRPLAGTTTGAVSERGSSLVSNATSPQELKRMFPAMANSVTLGLCSALSVPLVTAGDVFGALHLRSKLPMAYSDHHVQLALQVADQIAGGVEKSLLFEQAERNAVEQEALAAIGLAVNTELDIDRIYETVADRVNRLVSYDRLVISLRVPDSDEVEFVYVRGAQIKGGGVGSRMVPSFRHPATGHLAVDDLILAGAESATPGVVEIGLRSWVEVPFRSRDGEIGFLSLRSFAENAFSKSQAEFLHRVAAQVAPAIVNARLVANLVEANRLLGQSEARSTAVLESASDAIVLTGQDGRIISINAAAESMLGVSREQAGGRDLLELCVSPSSNERWAAEFGDAAGAPSRPSTARYFEFTAHRQDGSEFAAECAFTRFDLQGSLRVVAVVRDISARKLAERNLEVLATTDTLTGLLNRHQFGQMLDQAIRFARRRNTTGALVYLDLDNFKYVNDTYGHRVGDRLLEAIAQKLKSSIRSSDIVARIGGDEFSVVLLDTVLDDAMRKARRILDSVASSTVAVGGEKVNSTVSAGIALFPSGDATSDDLMAFADIAMYRAKEAGRSSVAVYRPEERARESVSALQRIRHIITDSLSSDRVLLFRQRVVSTTTRETAFWEVLVRLRDAEGRILMPAEFIPQAEDLDLIQAIDRVVAEQAMRRWRAVADAGQQVKLAVNVSGRTVAPQFVDFLVDRARLLRVPAGEIHLEITETAAMRGGGGTSQCLFDLAEAGFPIVLDDFGSGLTSFRQLNELPLAMLKLDGALVKAGAERRSDRALLKALIDFAHHIGMPVVGEHVEDQTILQMLGDLGVEYSQGFLFGRPEAFD